MLSEDVIKTYMSHPSMQRIFRTKLHGGHFNYVHERAAPYINHALKGIMNISDSGGSINFGGTIGIGGGLKEQLESIIQNRNNFNIPPIPSRPSMYNHNHPYGTKSVGGSVRMGGGMYPAGALHMGDQIQNHQDAYYFALHLTPIEVECLREIAIQILGGKASGMWGNMVDPNDKLEAKPEHYDQIAMMPNSHSMARMIDAESGYGRGGGFGKAFKHVARIGSRIYKAGHHALKWANKNKDVLLGLPGIEKYKDEVNMFLDTANRIDDSINPIVEATIDAVKEGATQEDREKLKKMAEESIKKVVEEKVPHGKDIVKLAEDVRETIQNRNSFN